MENNFKIKEAAKGVTICSYQTSRFKTSRISFNMAVPLDENASANAILPYLLNRSCAKYPDFSQLNAKLAELYGAVLIPKVTKVGEAQVMSLSVSAVDDRFSFDKESILIQCIELMCNLIFEPNADNGEFNSGEVDREKRLLLEKIESEKNDKRVYALRRCEEIMCADEAFGINCLGNADGVDALTPRTVYNAWKNMLESAVIQINIVGSIDTDAAEEIIVKRFEGLKRDSIADISTKIIKSAKEVKHVSEELPINQGKLVLGYRAGMENPESDEYAAVRVMTDLFGGAPYSKLFMNVREKLSLCYYCSARLFKQKSLIIVQSGIEKENEEKAITEINRQLTSLQSGEFTDDELKASLTGLNDALNRVTDTPEDIDAWCFSQMTSAKFTTPQELSQKISAVTRERVCDAAKNVTLDTVYMLSGEEEEA